VLGEVGDDLAVRAMIEDVRKFASAPLTAGNRVTALIDGPETFAAIAAAIEAAQRQIHVETFIFSDDKLGRQFAALLARKRSQGLEVRVLYDSIGSIDTATEFFDELRGKDVEVRQFRPLNPIDTPKIWKFQNRDHRKIIVVDGKVGFIGGVNISATYSSASSTKPGPDRGVMEGWRDTHLRIDGPAVAHLQALFVDMWNRASSDTPLSCAEECFPTLAPVGKDLVAIVANDSDDADDRSLYATYLAAFTHATSRIWLTHAYFAPNEDLLKALMTAAQRGVDVRLIMPGFSDSSLILHATRSTYTRLLKSGIRIYENTDAFLHAKTVVIDGALSVVGSANLDMRSFVHNDEANAVVVSRDFAQRMEAVFQHDQQAARALDLKTWKQRSLWERFEEFASRLMGYWL
jgi:cardiolipin synthase